jgi:hypothetical protein
VVHPSGLPRHVWANSNHALIHQNLRRLRLKATGRQRAQRPALPRDSTGWDLAKKNDGQPLFGL